MTWWNQERLTFHLQTGFTVHHTQMNFGTLFQISFNPGLNGWFLLKPEGEKEKKNVLTMINLKSNIAFDDSIMLENQH